MVMTFMVSFALEDNEPGEVVILILLRTPKCESLIPEDQRGVSVSHEVDFEDEDQYLRRIRLAVPVPTIESTRRAYELDVSAGRSGVLIPMHRFRRCVCSPRRGC